MEIFPSNTHMALKFAFHYDFDDFRIWICRRCFLISFVTCFSLLQLFKCFVHRKNSLKINSADLYNKSMSRYDVLHIFFSCDSKKKKIVSHLVSCWKILSGEKKREREKKTCFGFIVKNDVKSFRTATISTGFRLHSFKNSIHIHKSRKSTHLACFGLDRVFYFHQNFRNISFFFVRVGASCVFFYAI